MSAPTLRAERNILNYTQAFIPVTDPPSGGWTWFVEPTALEQSGKIYFTYIDGSTGSVAIRTVDSSTLSVSPETVLHTALQQDDHDVPSVLIRSSDNKVMCWYCQHAGSNLYQKISSNPLDISTFGAEVDLSVSIGITTGFTYPSPVELVSETNSPIYLFYRDQDHFAAPTTNQLYYTKSTDGGATWAPRTLLYADAGHSSYWKIVDNGTNRIDFAVTDGHPYWDAPNIIRVGHFYYTGGSFFKTDGTAMGNPPFSFSSVSTVYSGSASSWIWDVAMSSGNPRIAYATWPSYPQDTRLNWASWTGSVWDNHEVCRAGSRDLDPTNGHYYTGGIGFNQLDPSTVYCSRELNTQMEMFKYTTPDNGSTWTGTQLTYNSPGVNIRPVGIRNYAGKIAALWMYAPTYNGYTSYSAGVRAANA